MSNAPSPIVALGSAIPALTPTYLQDSNVLAKIFCKTLDMDQTQEYRPCRPDNMRVSFLVSSTLLGAANRAASPVKTVRITSISN